MRADRALLRMVLVNLISNALKFTGTRAEARSEIGCASGGDGETVIFIRDNGAGFDPRYAGKFRSNPGSARGLAWPDGGELLE